MPQGYWTEGRIVNGTNVGGGVFVPTADTSLGTVSLSSSNGAKTATNLQTDLSNRNTQIQNNAKTQAGKVETAKINQPEPIPPEVQNELNLSKTPSQLAEEEAKARYDKAYQDTISSYEPLALANTQATQALIASLTQQYQQRKKEIELINKTELGVATQSGLRSGAARYAPEINQGILTDTENRGIARLQELDRIYTQAVSEANTALSQKNYTLAKEKFDSILKVEQQFYQETKERNAEAKKVNDALQAKNREINVGNYVSQLVTQGVSDPNEIRQILNETYSGDFTAKEIGDALKVFTPNEALAGLNADYKTYKYLTDIGDPSVKGMNYLGFKSAVANAERKPETAPEDKPITISNEKKAILLGAGFSQSDIMNIEKDVQQYGLDKVLEGITNENQKKALRKIYGVEEKVTREQIESSVTSKMAYDGLKETYTEDELKDLADDAGLSSMWTGKATDIERFLNSTEARKLYIDILYKQYEDAGMTESPPSNFNSSANSEKTTGQYSKEIGTTILPNKQTYLSKDEKNPFVEFLLKVKDKIPVFESRSGKAMKQDALNHYSFTSEAQNMIKNMTKIRDDSPQVDLALNLVKDKQFNSDNPLGSAKENISIASNYEFPYYGYTEEPTYGRQDVSIKNPHVVVIGHELIHTLFRTTQVDPDDFNQEWETIKGSEIYNYVAEQLSDPIYREMSDKQLASERFAFLGSLEGTDGLQNIPENLQRFYTRIFKP